MKQRHIYLEIRVPEFDGNEMRKYEGRIYWAFNSRSEVEKWITEHSAEYPPETTRFILHDFYPLSIDEFAAFQRQREDAKFVKEVTQEMEIGNLRQNKKPEE